jgi:hypothetical protein
MVAVFATTQTSLSLLFFLVSRHDEASSDLKKISRVCSNHWYEIQQKYSFKLKCDCYLAISAIPYRYAFFPENDGFDWHPCRFFIPVKNTGWDQIRIAYVLQLLNQLV